MPTHTGLASPQPDRRRPHIVLGVVTNKSSKKIQMERRDYSVKVADNVGKPITEFEEGEEGNVVRRLFFVTEGDTIYSYEFR